MGCGCDKAKTKDTCASCVFGTAHSSGWIWCERYSESDEEPVMVRGTYHKYKEEQTTYVREGSKCQQHQAR
jgi:hypothetical protein